MSPTPVYLQALHLARSHILPNDTRISNPISDDTHIPVLVLPTYKFPTWGYVVGVLSVLLFCLLSGASCSYINKKVNKHTRMKEREMAGGEGTALLVHLPRFDSTVHSDGNRAGRAANSNGQGAGHRGGDGDGEAGHIGIPAAENRYRYASQNNGSFLSVGVVRSPKKALLVPTRARQSTRTLIRGLPSGALMDIEMAVIISKWRREKSGRRRSRSISSSEVVQAGDVEDLLRQSLSAVEETGQVSGGESASASASANEASCIATRGETEHEAIQGQSKQQLTMPGRARLREVES